jgi:type IV secretion system protein VirB8
MLNKDKTLNNWGQDQYSYMLVQRNLLIIFSILISVSLMFSLVILKRIYNTRGVEPYIIEYNKDTGVLSSVNSTTKKEFTANQAIRESLVFQYINNFAINLWNVEEKINNARLSSTPEIYAEFIRTAQGMIQNIKKTSPTAYYEIKINSLSYFAQNRIELKFTQTLKDANQIISTNENRAMISFRFVDLDLTGDEVFRNPLGFQVTSFNIIKEEKVQ